MSGPCCRSSVRVSLVSVFWVFSSLFYGEEGGVGGRVRPASLLCLEKSSCFLLAPQPAKGNKIASKAKTRSKWVCFIGDDLILLSDAPVKWSWGGGVGYSLRWQRSHQRETNRGELRSPLTRRGGRQLLFGGSRFPPRLRTLLMKGRDLACCLFEIPRAVDRGTTSSKHIDVSQTGLAVVGIALSKCPHAPNEVA